MAIAGDIHAMTIAIVRSPEGRLELNLFPWPELSADDFFALCAANRDLRIERTASGEIVIMPPAGGATGNRNQRINTGLGNWTERDGTGVGFDSSTGFILPNGATRAPDAAWVRRDRLAALSPEQKERFLPLAPDFVIELRSPSDSLAELQAKMEEYIANGVRLGWLIDPIERMAYLYRPGVAPKRLVGPEQLTGDPELPGFTLPMAEVWHLGW
jgi:Uma2 family endonuclease